MPSGRLTDYCPEIVEKAWKYVDGGWIEAGDKVPSVAGLACEIGIHRETCYDWARDKDKVFSDILKALAQKQERTLLNNGLDGTFNPPITKMMLSKHGYSDKIETDLTSSDGSMTPQALNLKNLSDTELEAMGKLMAKAQAQTKEQ
jgi:hypothetical protein